MKIEASQPSIVTRTKEAMSSTLITNVSACSDPLTLKRLERVVYSASPIEVSSPFRTSPLPIRYRVRNEAIKKITKDFMIILTMLIIFFLSDLLRLEYRNISVRILEFYLPPYCVGICLADQMLF